MHIVKDLHDIEKDIINWRRELHKRAEIGLILPLTEEYLKKELEKMQIDYTLYQECSGISAVIGKKNKKVVGLRADIDATAIKEATNLEFSSQTDAMHSCGHDAHAAMLLGVAKILKKHEDKLKGQVKIIFQPGEEYDKGAKVLVEQGILENPKIDIMFAQHILLAPNIKSGMIAIKNNQIMASADDFYIKVIGKGGHASEPQNCVDPIIMATQVITNIYQMMSREISPLDSVSLSIVNVKSEQPSKVVYNIIPNYVEIIASVRCLDNKMRDYINKRVEEITKSTVEGLRGKYEYQYNYNYPALVNNEFTTNLLRESTKKILGEEFILNLSKPVMASEDTAFYFEKIPGTYYGITVGDLNNKNYYPVHHPQMIIDESSLINGVAVMLQATIDYLNK
ncbi:MAG: M20 metallopeptidase family protein [Cetobacterium sp.]|uniref:M20 metallopeptidase family protein n=1 Tax=Cetobacterium sp. TaxID=2071632 RepID=UPI003EE48E5C